MLESGVGDPGGSVFLVVPKDDSVQARKKRQVWERLSPLQRALFATDGSFTLLLQALTGEPIAVDILAQEKVRKKRPLPLLKLPAHTQVLQRDVLLRTAHTNRPIIFARSTAALPHLPKVIQERLLTTNDPIGLILRWQRLETFRELFDWGITDAEYASSHFNNEPVLYRTYTIIANQRPCMVVSEFMPLHTFQVAGDTV